MIALLANPILVGVLSAVVSGGVAFGMYRRGGLGISDLVAVMVASFGWLVAVLVSLYSGWWVAVGALWFVVFFVAVLAALESFDTKIDYAVALVLFASLIAASMLAPEFVSTPDLGNRSALPSLTGMTLGTDMSGVPILDYALQGAGVVTGPALASGVVLAMLATLAGVSRCAALGWTDPVLQAFSELVGALPRLVVILVVALALPKEGRSLYPIAITWAFLAAPGAMDEAAATAGRLGGSKFVEALRAHGFNAARIYLYHIIWLNLRPVIVRQAAEVGMQVIFLEIALSYLAASQRQPSFTHPDSTYSWAKLLYDGYSAIVGGTPMYHALVVGVLLVALTAIMAQAFRLGARAR